ncbi:MAG: nucleotide sugar dehydrogenase [Alphaproteobacteria bacterium]|nr:nucleotide sugar dehydrogenase [Alphaproteobacteria bacterium]
MDVSVFGIGYVGAVTSACLSDSGHNIIAVDTFDVKVQCINEGRSPIVENGLDDLISKGLKSGKLRATTDYVDAINNSDVSLVCVGTPSAPDGSLGLNFITDICEQIGEVLKTKDTFHTVVIRSTVIPGTLMNVVLPCLEKASGKKAGVDFGLGNNPEFLRESTAIADYYDPTEIVVGALDDKTAKMIMGLYEGIEAPRVVCDVQVAEGVKYVSNAWRAAKVGFANEMGNILKEHDVDSHKVMDIFFKDTKMNLSKYFLTPGFAFGGSCLPKDVRAIRASANDKGLKTPLLDSLLSANKAQIQRGFDMIKETGKTKIGLFGLSFKAGTDDLRESPLVELANLLLMDGFELSIYDPCVYKASQMDGANKDYITKGLPQIYACIREKAQDVVDSSELFVIGNGTKEFASIIEQADSNKSIIDLVRLGSPMEERENYSGICW